VPFIDRYFELVRSRCKDWLRTIVETLVNAPWG